ncbi:4'-phosphopantetheinyl transferase [Pseudomonas sp. dw_358]|uniref:4'-phosphopantetheinyl transferase family protein n=1 Tax=Pseudomonas sp. dw_358 TaxID=2720083 RepID=UPI001BD6DD18|nr:4'-phosphopantetheinyl transferase [Pseudomonas sp. dw_358]
MNRPSSAPVLHWPLPCPLPGAVLAGCHFDPARHSPDEFLRQGIAAPANIQRSVAKRQAEFLAGRVCARTALQALGIPDWVAAVGEDRAPVWPAGICGAITHGAGWAGAVVARTSAWRGLGLDMEHLLEPQRAWRLHGEILTADERRRMARHPAEQVSLIVTLTFSLKESLFKALYPLVLKRFYFEHAEIVEWHEDGRARLRLLSDLSAQWTTGAEFEGQFCVADGRLLSLVWVT